MPIGLITYPPRIQSFGFKKTLPPLINLSLWLDAALDITKSGTDVSVWGDQSDVGNDATQGTTDLMPDWLDAQVNGLPVVKGDGANDIMNLASNIVASGDFAIFIVIGGVTSPNYMWGYSSTLYGRYTNNSMIWRNSTTHSFDHTNKVLTTDYFIHHLRRVGTDVRSYRNNVESITGAVTNALAVTLNKLFSWGTEWGSGAIAEMLIYNGVLSTDEVNQTLNYLNTKYVIY